MLSPDMQRIEKIRDYCVRVENTIDRFGNDIDYQMVVSFCILQIGELSGALSMEYREATASRIQWGPIKGMRNWVAHRYGGMRLETIWETATIDIPVLKQFCEEQLSEADKSSEGGKRQS